MAIESVHRNCHKIIKASLFCQFPIVSENQVERLLGKSELIHFVNGQNHFPDTQERDQIAMPPGFRQHSFVGIDQNDRKIGIRYRRHYIASVLFMAGRVGQDELTAVSGERTIAYVNGRALLATGLQISGIAEQSPDQSPPGLFLAAADDEPQQALALGRPTVRLYVAAYSCKVRLESHQKYPSCWFFPCGNLVDDGPCPEARRLGWRPCLSARRIQVHHQIEACCFVI